MAAIVAAGGTGFELAGTRPTAGRGLELIQRTNPSLVVTDIRMPRKDGLEMVENLRREESGYRWVAIVTGYDDSAYARAALRFGVVDYLLKPSTAGPIPGTPGLGQGGLGPGDSFGPGRRCPRAKAAAALPAARELRIRELLEGRSPAGADRNGLLGITSGTVFCARGPALPRFRRNEPPVAFRCRGRGVFPRPGRLSGDGPCDSAAVLLSPAPATSGGRTWPRPPGQAAPEAPRKNG
jgi:hypothetical protein